MTGQMFMEFLVLVAATKEAGIITTGDLGPTTQKRSQISKAVEAQKPPPDNLASSVLS